MCLRNLCSETRRAAALASPVSARKPHRRKEPTMEYELPEEIQMLRQAVREFAEKEIAPIAREIDEEERVPFEVLKKAGELGLMGVPFPEQYGGADAGVVDDWVLNGSKMWITNGSSADVLLVFASTDRKLGARGGVTALIVEKDFPGFK